MHALAKHREVKEKNFLLPFLCYGNVLFNELIKKFLQINYKSGTQSPYATFNFLYTLRQYNPSNTLFSYFKALLSSGISFLQQVQIIFDSYYISGFYCLKRMTLQSTAMCYDVHSSGLFQNSI